MEAMINGIKLNYIDTGNSQALPIVLIHGMTFDHKSWNPQIEILKQNYRVIAYDIRGHGKSDILDGQYTYKMFADDLIALLDYLKIDKAVLCGLSMGGIVAMRTFDMYPDRIKALIFCDTRSDADSNETKNWRENAIELIKKEGLEPFADEFIELCAPKNFVKFPEDLEIIRETILLSSPLGICGALLAQAARPDLECLLPQIDVPTLIMVGENDYLTPLDLSKFIHENIPGSELKIISNACHISNLENRDEFNKYLLEFLEKID